MEYLNTSLEIQDLLFDEWTGFVDGKMRYYRVPEQFDRCCGEAKLMQQTPRRNKCHGWEGLIGTGLQALIKTRA